jgi:hypothetical protein
MSETKSSKNIADPRVTEEPTREEIAELAYQLWIERGSPHGSQEEDWHRAEAQLRGGQSLSKAAGA